MHNAPGVIRAMTETQINYFIEVSKTLSITKVAQRFYVSQPAVSKQIMMLEQELGCKLFNRDNSQMSLTNCGAMFFDFFVEYRKQLHSLTALAQKLSNSSLKTIRFGILEGWDTKLCLTDIIDTFSKKESVYVTLESHGFADLSNALSNRKLDIIMDLNKIHYDPQIYESTIIAEISRVLIYPAWLDQQNKRPLTMCDFKNSRFFVISDKEVATSIDSVRDCCVRYGFIPDIQLVPNIPSMILGVQHNLGVTIGDEWMGATQNAELAHIRLLDMDKHQVRLVWLKNSHSDVRNFALQIKQHFQSEMYKD